MLKTGQTTFAFVKMTIPTFLKLVLVVLIILIMCLYLIYLELQKVHANATTIIFGIQITLNAYLIIYDSYHVQQINGPQENQMDREAVSV